KKRAHRNLTRPTHVKPGQHGTQANTLSQASAPLPVGERRQRLALHASAGVKPERWLSPLPGTALRIAPSSDFAASQTRRRLPKALRRITDNRSHHSSRQHDREIIVPPRGLHSSYSICQQ